MDGNKNAVEMTRNVRLGVRRADVADTGRCQRKAGCGVRMMY